jgi:hypothetical protein
MATTVSEGGGGLMRVRELDKGAAAGCAGEAALGNEDVGHVPVAPKVAAKVGAAGAWRHVTYVQLHAGGVWLDTVNTIVKRTLSESNLK